IVSQGLAFRVAVDDDAVGLLPGRMFRAKIGHARSALARMADRASGMAKARLEHVSRTALSPYRTEHHADRKVDRADDELCARSPEREQGTNVVERMHDVDL